MYDAKGQVQELSLNWSERKCASPTGSFSPYFFSVPQSGILLLLTLAVLILVKSMVIQLKYGISKPEGVRGQLRLMCNEFFPE
jgi:hypothetical protein